MTRFYDDFSTGETFELGSYEVAEAEIREFAEQYDPQWFHTDPERAREESIYGDLIASGWHTAAMTMRLLVDGLLADAASLGAKGVDELRWWKPVFPDDTLTGTVEVVECDSERPDRGLVRLAVETDNGQDETVFSMVGNVLFARRGGQDGRGERDD